MIAIDSSVIVVIAQEEPEMDSFFDVIKADGEAALCTANYLEASLVLEGRHGPTGRATFESTIDRLVHIGLKIVSVDLPMAELARDAFRRFGKGRHPAKLNFGDCFAYALAKALDVPLLFKGTDFGKTDLKPLH